MLSLRKIITVEIETSTVCCGLCHVASAAGRETITAETETSLGPFYVTPTKKSLHERVIRVI